jgi:M6 family metalloprotease-like protein
MKKFILTILLTVTAMTMMAVPAKRGQWKTLTLQDGTEVRATLVGDEHGHFWKAENGQAYAERGGVWVAVDGQQIIKKAKARRAKVNAQRVKRRTFGHPTTILGKKKAIMILVNFKDKSFQSSHDNALFNRIANEEGFSEGNFKGSMADYFKAQSRGKFELDFDIVGPVTVTKKYSYYGENDAQGSDKHAGEMVCEAVELAKNEVQDWTPYDWDNDGYVDQVYLVYAGKGAADGGADDTIWPHAYDLTAAHYYGDGSGPVEVGTNLWVSSYACGPELDGTHGTINGIGTMCHEYSHCLGYPDFYDTDYSGGQGMGAWDLMDAGPYNGDGFQPAGYTSYERWFAGWEEPIELKAEDVEVRNMKSLQNGGEFYIIYNDKNANEYYLLENRQQDGWDASTPFAGLLILHCDYDATVWENNGPNDDPNHQRFTVVPADGEYSYYVWDDTKYYDDAEPFPYGSVNAFNRKFKTKDDHAKNAARFFTKTSNGTYWMNGSVEEIKQNNDKTIDFDFVANFSVGLQGDTYEKVTSADQLVAGKQYVLINEANNAGNGSFNEKYLTAVDVDVVDNTVSGDDLAPITLGGDASGYSLQIDGKYVYTVAAKALKLGDEEKKDWLIESTTNGYVVKSKTSSNGTIKYNASSPRFMNYTSNQKPAVLYVQKTSTAIKSIHTNKTVATRIYTLDGRYVGADPNLLPRGLYIIGGKKIVK